MCCNDGITRYNSTEHSIPFHKAQDLGKVPKKLAAGPAPDLEEAFDVSLKDSIRSSDSTYPQQMDDIIDDASDDEKKNPDDISNDKLIQQTKRKSNGSKGKSKGKK